MADFSRFYARTDTNSYHLGADTLDEAREAARKASLDRIEAVRVDQLIVKEEGGTSVTCPSIYVRGKEYTQRDGA